MEITWQGLSSFILKGEKATLAVDPQGSLQDIRPHIVLISYDDTKNNLSAIDMETCKIFDWPGEYEVKGTIIKSIPILKGIKEKCRILVWEMDDIVICHLSILDDILDDSIVENIGNVDILMVPVGNHHVLDGKKAHEIVEKIDPSMVIPMYFATEDMKDTLDGPEKFLKEIGKTTLEPQKKLKITKSKLPIDNTEFVLLLKELR